MMFLRVSEKTFQNLSVIAGLYLYPSLCISIEQQRKNYMNLMRRFEEDPNLPQ